MPQHQEPQEERVGCPLESREIEAVRARVHKMADVMQTHEIRLAEQAVIAKVQGETLEALRQSTATREQLELVSVTTKQHVDVAIAGVSNDLKRLETSVGAQVQSVKDDLAPIKRGVYWAVGLVMSAVGLALLGLVLRGGRL